MTANTANTANMVIRQCTICGTDIACHVARGRKKKYCAECAKQVQYAQSVAWRQKNIEKSRQYHADYMRDYYRDREKNRKHRVRCATGRLYRAGMIVMQPQCVMCGTEEDLELHHMTYDGVRAPWLVMTICTACHGKTRLRVDVQSGRLDDVGKTASE